jgi:hypothetical protein
MKKKDFNFIKYYFVHYDCELLESVYVNNNTKMNYKCKCGLINQITFSQFCKSPQCSDCGVRQMKNSKNNKIKKCRICSTLLTEENKKKDTNKTKYGNVCHVCFNDSRNNLYKHHSNHYYRKHNKKRLSYWAERRKNNPELIKEQARKSQEKLKLNVISHYSPELKCVKCGYNEHMAALSIDHINGGGCKHQKEIGGHLYLWLKRNNFPTNFQVLCMCCQWIKRIENKECIKTSMPDKWYYKNKQIVYDHYSPCCAKCKFNDTRALSIDHINGDGAKHRKKIGSSITSWLIKNNFPSHFQILCWNCQWIKRHENKEYRCN